MVNRLGTAARRAEPWHHVGGRTAAGYISAAARFFDVFDRAVQRVPYDAAQAASRRAQAARRAQRDAALQRAVRSQRTASAGAGGGDASDAAIAAALRRQARWADVTEGDVARVPRGGGGDEWMELHAVNHGGMRLRLREAIAKRPRLRGLVDDESLVWQAGARLYTTLKRASEQASLVLISETHISRDDSAACARMRALLTTGEFAGWALLEAHAPGDWSGMVVWYNTAGLSVSEARVLVAGRVATARVRSTVDDTVDFRLVAAYRHPQRTQETAQQEAGRRAVDAAITSAVDAAEMGGEEVAVAGDLQAQTRSAAELRGAELGAEGEWLEGLLAVHDLVSVCGTDATYVARGRDGVQVATAIDHRLLSDGLARRSEGLVGPGVDGLRLADAERGEVGKGHNSVVVRVRLAAAGAAGDGPAARRQAQMRALTKEEEEVYAAEEAAAVRAAIDAAGVDATGAQVIEAIEAAGRALQGRIIEVADATEARKRRPELSDLARQDRTVRRRQRLLGRVRRARDTDPMLCAGDAGGALGRTASEDAEMASVLAAARGEARRGRLERLLAQRLQAAVAKQRALGRELGADRDRVASALLATLRELRTRGETAVWEVFRAVGRARADEAEAEEAEERRGAAVASTTRGGELVMCGDAAMQR